MTTNALRQPRCYRRRRLRVHPHPRPKGAPPVAPRASTGRLAQPPRTLSVPNGPLHDVDAIAAAVSGPPARKVPPVAPRTSTGRPAQPSSNAECSERPSSRRGTPSRRPLRFHPHPRPKGAPPVAPRASTGGPAQPSANTECSERPSSRRGPPSPPPSPGPPASPPERCAATRPQRLDRPARAALLER